MSWWNSHKRQVYTVVAITMSVSTPIVTAYCTKKAMDKVNEKGVTSKKDIAKTVAPYAIAPIATTVLGTTAGILAYNEGTKALTTASTAISAITASNKIYDDIVKDVVGEKKHKEIEKKVVEAISEAPAKAAVKSKEIGVISNDDGEFQVVGPTSIVCDTGHGDVVFREKWSNQLIRTSWDHIRSVCNDLNALKNDGYDITVNNLLLKLGARTCELGDAYYFPNGIKYMADDEHLYTRDDKNQPLGILEFAMGYNPVPANKVLATI